MPEDPRLLDAAELYCELWGGHPGTANKRVGVNGRSVYPIAENRAAAGHCTHLYPLIPLRRDDVINGYNALQFACDQGKTFWGHFIVDNACLRAGLPAGHPDLKKLDLDGFHAAVRLQPREGESLEVRLEASRPDRIRMVDFQGFFEGYDENGDGESRDWHGFTKGRRPEAWLGHAGSAPFSAVWDASMTAGRTARARARIAFHDAPGILYETAPSKEVPLPGRETFRVQCVLASGVPVPFWSRARELRSARISLPARPSAVERAQLHVVVWDGGRGSVTDPFRFNGAPVEVCGRGAHDVIYSVRDLPPSALQPVNSIELLSDTDHHGIEILFPGPALLIRTRQPRS